MTSFTIRRLFRHIPELLMLLLSLVFLSPLYYLVVSTFKTQKEIVEAPFRLPGNLNFSNYAKALDSMNYFLSFKNSFIIALGSIILIVLFGSLAAYAIVRRSSKWTSFVMIYFLIGFMIPLQTTVLPLFMIMKYLHLINTLTGLIILNSGGAVFAFFIYQGFIRTVPIELEESAKCDGANLWTLFWRIVFPLLKPITVTIVIINTIWIWNDFVTPFLFLSSQKKATMVMQIYNGVGQFSNDWTIMLPILVLVQMPMVIFYFLMQKQIIAGVTDGSVKM